MHEDWITAWERWNERDYAFSFHSQIVITSQNCCSWNGKTRWNLAQFLLHLLCSQTTSISKSYCTKKVDNRPASCSWLVPPRRVFPIHSNCIEKWSALNGYQQLLWQVDGRQTHNEFVYSIYLYVAHHTILIIGIRSFTKHHQFSCFPYYYIIYNNIIYLAQTGCHCRAHL